MTQQAAMLPADTASSNASPQEARGWLRWAIAISVAIGALLEIVDTSIVNVALTDMQASLGTTLSEIGWVVTSYGIANVIVLPLAAWLGVRFGKKRYFVFSLVAFTASSILCGLSTNLPMLIGARVLQGLFGGGLLAKAQSILFETFPKEEQAMAQALFGAVVIAGPAIGPTLGGYIVTNLDWRWIFFINLPIGIIAVLMSVTFLPKDDPKDKSSGGIDWFAIGLLAVGLGCLQTALEEGQSEDWFESKFIVAFSILAVLGLVCFVWRELVVPNPIVDLRVLRYRSLWVGSILSSILGMGLYGALFAVPIFTQSILNYTSEQTGFLLLPGALASAFAMPLAARLLSKFDPRVLLVAGSLIVVAAMVMFTQLTPQTGSGDLFWPLIVRAFGTVMMFLPLNMAALGSVPKRDVAAATGFYNLTRQLGGSIGIAILTTLLAQREAFHRAVLVAKLGISDGLTQERVRMLTGSFIARGSDVTSAHQKALLVLDGTVNVQAAVMSFADMFYFTAVIFALSLPLIFLLGKPDRAKGAALGH